MSSRKKSVVPGSSEPALMKERDVPPASEWKKSPYFGRKDPFWWAATSTTSLLSPKRAPLCLFEDTNSRHEALISPSSVLRFMVEGTLHTIISSSRPSQTLFLVGKSGLMISSRTGASISGFRRPGYWSQWKYLDPYPSVATMLALKPWLSARAPRHTLLYLASMRWGPPSRMCSCCCV